METFKTWLDQFEANDDHLGFISRAVAADPEFPDATRLLDIERYLQDKARYEGLLPAFTTAWDKFQSETSE